MKIKLNDNYTNLNKNYLFSEIARRVTAYTVAHPDKNIIRLGIGDVTLPLPKCVTQAMHAAVDEMGRQETFRGYAPEAGYPFIRQMISDYYARRKVVVAPDEIYVGDGAKSDIGNITDIFGNNPVLIPDPVYPVYVDSNIMCGREVKYISANESNGFLPPPPIEDDRAYVIYMCSPNNPTGAVYNAVQLKEWVNYALKTGSLIIFDSAYEAFVSGGEPRSIFEIDGARGCAVEICSLSKTAGFTGTRLGWTIIPRELEKDGIKIGQMWDRRQSTKFNGVPYVIQRAGEAALSEQGVKECRSNIEYYMTNASMIAKVLKDKNIWFTGGVSSPYIWLKCPDGMGSWEFFDYLLSGPGIVGTPGAGFGKQGEGYFRLTAFGSRQATQRAVEILYDTLNVQD